MIHSSKIKVTFKSPLYLIRYLKKEKIHLLFFLLLTTSIIGQTKKDSLFKSQNSIVKKEPEIRFSKNDLTIIDSLLTAVKYRSPLYDTVQYFIKNIDQKEVQSVALSSAVLKERLNKINAETPFHIAYNPALEKVIKSYLKYRKKDYSNLMARAEYYFPMFEKYLDAFNIPLEMKYLAVVESALLPRAKSRVGATGLWQFMYTTGIQYKLKVSSYVDERQDPVKATIAACKYLRDLYQIFGDWDLSLAAYNSGPGNVFKAIKRSGGYKNYWNIRPFLPRETADYVPAFYATMYLFEYAKEHHLKPKAPKIYHFETDTIHIKRTISFNQISAITGIAINVLEFLNPSYKLDIIPFIKEKNYSVKIPREVSLLFLEKEKELYALAKTEESKREKPLPRYFEMDKRIRYKVQKGDYLGKIANRFGVRVSNLKKWNQLKNNQLKVGQRLTVYPKKLNNSKKNPKNKKKLSKKGTYVIYIVKKGDSLWKIAKKFPPVSINQIKKWNNIWSAKNLKPGTELKIFKS